MNTLFGPRNDLVADKIFGVGVCCATALLSRASGGKLMNFGWCVRLVKERWDKWSCPVAVMAITTLKYHTIRSLQLLLLRCFFYEPSGRSA